jgi:hypothetical protein
MNEQEKSPLTQLVALESRVRKSNDGGEIIDLCERAAPLRKSVIAQYLPMMNQLAAAGLLSYFDTTTGIGGEVSTVCVNGGFQLNCDSNNQPDAIVTLPWRDFSGMN